VLYGCIAAAVVLLGYLVLGVTGFGSALVIVPLLAWRWPLVEVVPLVLLMDLVASALMGRMNLRRVAWPELRSLLPGMVLGCVLGLLLSRHLTSVWPLLFLGGYVVWVGWRTLGGPPPATSPSTWMGGLYGLGVGVVQMSFGTAGPLVLAWLARRGRSMAVCRGKLTRQASARLRLGTGSANGRVVRRLGA